MKEEEDKKDKEEIIKAKINFYEEQIDIQLNSDFKSFVNNICNILKIPSEQYNSLAISYNDEDGDNIILSTEEDYILYFQQLKDKTVNGLIVEVKEDSKIDPIACFGSAINYQEQIDEANKQIQKENNNLNKDIKNNINNNNINNNIINNNDNIKDYFNNNNNLIINNEPQKEKPINDIIFEFGCSSCSTYPIICTLYYCPQCQMHLCEDCMRKVGNHAHPFQLFESNQEFMKYKENEKKEKEKMDQMQNNHNNYNYNNNPNIVNNNNNNFNNYNNNPYIGNNNNNNFNNYYRNNEQYRFDFLDPFKLLRNERFKNGMKMGNIIWPGMFFFQKEMEYKKYKKIISNARKTYNLEGIDDNQLIDALKKTNGNIDQAFVLLANK